MPLPSEYVIEDAVRSIDEVIVFRGQHPIHGQVDIYLPDEALPAAIAAAVRKRLYQNGRRMRNISLMDLRFVAKSLEVSQDPRDPYIVTKRAEHDIAEFIGNGLVVKPARCFAIISQSLEALIGLAANGWETERLSSQQIKLDKLESGSISLNVVEVPQHVAEAADAVSAVDETVTVDLKDPGSGDETGDSDDDGKHYESIRKNIYTLGTIACQLLFARQYQGSDKRVCAKMGKLSSRWRKIMNKSLARDNNAGYKTYEAMLADVTAALTRNKRIAIGSIPFVLLAMAIAGYFGYQKYQRHRIMTSEGGQAIESFLEVVSKTDDEIVPTEKPQAGKEAEPDEEEILKPFEEIE